MTLPMSSGGASQSLDLHTGAQRVRKLLAERDRLLENIRKKRDEKARAVEQARERAERGSVELTAKSEALHERLASVREELRALFDELLAPARLSARARKEVARVRRMLEENGVFDDLSEEDGEDDDGALDPFGDPPLDEASFEAAGGESEEVAAKPAEALGKGHDALRSTFRRLALSIHPDRAADDADRERRTRLMKDATRAYDEGDLARLLEIERAGTLGDDRPTSEPSSEELQRTNRELRKQLRRLQRELGEVRAAVSAVEAPIDMLATLAEAEVEDLERTRDFVRAFRDGKITLARFVEGPVVDDEDELLDVDIASELTALLSELSAPRKRHGGRKGPR